MDIGAVAITALTWVPAGLAAGVANKGFEWLKEIVQRRQKEHQTGRVSALELWELLVRFARDCHEHACYNKEQGAGYIGIPKLPAYPEGVAWAVLPPKIAVGLRTLRIEIDAAKSGIRWVGERVDPGESIATATNSYVSLGNMALMLAGGLGRYYGMGRYQGADEYNFTRSLRKMRRELRRGPLRRAWASLPAYKIRRCVRRLTRRVGKTFHRPFSTNTLRTSR